MTGRGDEASTDSFNPGPERRRMNLPRLTAYAALLLIAHPFATASTPDGTAPGDDSRFTWTSSAPLIAPTGASAQTFHGYKDPSVVFDGSRYHVFMTTAGTSGWGLAYTSFTNWQDAPAAPITLLDKSPIGPGYRAAPQVFYFAPQKLWYLIFQGGDPHYSTTKDIGDPMSWSAPKPFFTKAPDNITQVDGGPAWLDFWNICDQQKCYLFFTDDHGSFYRSETSVDQFPRGYHDAELVMRASRPEDLFEASNTYKIAGQHKYLTLVEAIGPKGRYFRAWTADDLGGTWQPLPAARSNLFAGADNVVFSGRTWSDGISHGELVRSGIDQTLEIDPCKPLRLLYQGLDADNSRHYEYIELPYKLGLITASGANPVSAMCTSR